MYLFHASVSGFGMIYHFNPFWNCFGDIGVFHSLSTEAEDNVLETECFGPSGNSFVPPFSGLKIPSSHGVQALT
jgi:hypothetical protein